MILVPCSRLAPALVPLILLLPYALPDPSGALPDLSAALPALLLYLPEEKFMESRPNFSFWVSHGGHLRYVVFKCQLILYDAQREILRNPLFLLIEFFSAFRHHHVRTADQSRGFLLSLSTPSCRLISDPPASLCR